MVVIFKNRFSETVFDKSVKFGRFRIVLGFEQNSFPEFEKRHISLLDYLLIFFFPFKIPPQVLLNTATQIRVYMCMWHCKFKQHGVTLDQYL